MLGPVDRMIKEYAPIFKALPAEEKQAQAAVYPEACNAVDPGFRAEVKALHHMSDTQQTCLQLMALQAFGKLKGKGQAKAASKALSKMVGVTSQGSGSAAIGENEDGEAMGDLTENQTQQVTMTTKTTLSVRRDAKPGSIKALIRQLMAENAASRANQAVRMQRALTRPEPSSGTQAIVATGKRLAEQALAEADDDEEEVPITEPTAESIELGQLQALAMVRVGEEDRFELDREQLIAPQLNSAIQSALRQGELRTDGRATPAPGMSMKGQSDLLMAYVASKPFPVQGQAAEAKKAEKAEEAEEAEETKQEGEEAKQEGEEAKQEATGAEQEDQRVAAEGDQPKETLR